MSDFSLFEQALGEYDTMKKNEIITVESDVEEESSCSHSNVIEENGIVCCVDCGIEM